MSCYGVLLIDVYSAACVVLFVYVIGVFRVCIFFVKQKRAYEVRLSLVGSEMCIGDRCRV